MFFNRIVAPRFLGRPGDVAVADSAERDELPPILDYLERSCRTRAAILVGDRLTLADIAVASPFANFRHTETQSRPGALSAHGRLCRAHPGAAELRAMGRARDGLCWRSEPAA